MLMWKTMRLDVERREVLDQLLEKNMKKYCEEDSSEEEGGKSETVMLKRSQTVKTKIE